MMLNEVKFEGLFMHGGSNLRGLMIPVNTMRELGQNPFNFILGIPLNPEHELSSEEVSTMEKKVAGGLDREIKNSLVIWKKSKGEVTKPLWTEGKLAKLETGTSINLLGGCGSFWPFPLQREGSCATVMWKVVLPEGLTKEWMDSLKESLDGKLEGKFWTLSKK